ncbi:LuxR family transcriptional regulator [Tolypothrix sp. FACHB-123]|nr:LuxR family transcriptional regulator [Tolypothrix sp. FACHB-123]
MGHPLTSNYVRTGDGSAHMLSDFVTEEELHQLDIYEEFLHPLGLEEQLGAAIAVKPSQPGISKFYRTRQNIAVSVERKHRNFIERDRLVLNLIRPHLLEAYYSAQTFTQMQCQIAQLNQILEQTGVVILSMDGQVEEMTQRAETLIESYFQTSTPSLQLKPLPNTLQRWIKHQITQWTCTENIPPVSRPLQLERDGQRLTVRLNRHPNLEKFLLLLEESNHQAFSPGSLRLLGLTRREAEVLFWVAKDKGTADIAAILGISDRTVKKHLEHIYEKFGVQTRLAAVMYALEQLGIFTT